MWLKRALFVGIASMALAPLALLAWLLTGLPDPASLSEASPPPSTMILDRNGALLYEQLASGAGRSEPVPLNEIPRHLRDATVATEDARFYSHPGVDPSAIARAAYYSLRYRRIVSGASTITQQVARNLLLADEREERTLRRKLREAVLAVLIEVRYGKGRVLELYLNTTDYGRQAFGVQAAARAYFGKPVTDLDLAESAFLAGLPQAPSAYAPETGDAWRERQRVVLGLMHRDGYIGASDAALAERERLRLILPHHRIRAPHFVTYVREQLSRIVDQDRVAAGGLRVYTTLDLPAQERAEAALRQALDAINERDRFGVDVRIENGAVIAIAPETGAITVMVGSPDYFDTSADGAVNGCLSLRQPGSAIKPVTYAAAFERGVTPATMFTDVPSAFITAEGEAYVPLNYDFRFHGPVLVREALGSSYNIVAVKVLQRVGLPAFLDMARRLGISSLDSVSSLGLAATLGGGEVSLLELTVAYAVLANNGLSVRPYAIERVTDAGGRVLWQAPVYRDRQVISPQVVYLITDILSDDRARIPTFGEASVLALTRPAAVKTGTTTNFRDNWTVGYTPQMAVGVWVGNAGGGSMGRVSGVMGAAPVWHQVMEVLHRRLPVAQFAEPSGMVRLEVCAESGLLPGPYCPHRRRELFVAGTQPTSTCDMHVQLAVDRRTGYLAGAATPPGDVAERVYTVLPADALAWGDERGLPRPPLAAPGGAARQGGAILISSPPANAVYAMAADLPAWSQRVEFATAVGAGEPIAEVRLLVDAVAVATLTEAPYRTTWRLEPGDHTFSAEAETLDGRVYRSAITRVKVVRG